MKVKYLIVILILLVLGCSTSKSDTPLFNTQNNRIINETDVSSAISLKENVTDAQIESISFVKQTVRLRCGSPGSHIPFRKTTIVSIPLQDVAKNLRVLNNLLTENKTRLFPSGIRYAQCSPSQYYVFFLRRIII